MDLQLVFEPSTDGSAEKLALFPQPANVEPLGLAYQEKDGLEIEASERSATYASKGETPVAYAPGGRMQLLMISAVTNQGKTRWIIIQEFSARSG